MTRHFLVFPALFLLWAGCAPGTHAVPDPPAPVAVAAEGADAAAPDPAPRSDVAAQPDPAPPATPAAAPPATPKAVPLCEALPVRKRAQPQVALYEVTDFAGKSLPALTQEFGAPHCRRDQAYQWRLPRRCTDREWVITVWFARDTARTVHIEPQWTGLHCEFPE
jgi:hypothetical protein